MRYLLSSFVSVGLLFAMLLLPLHMLLSFFEIPGIISIFLVLLLIFLFWWFSGTLYDYFFEWRYRADWISYRDLDERHSAFSIYLRETLHKHDLSLKKIYLVDDDRPIAITYGPGKGGIRLLLSTGLFRYLDEKEQQAVIAHEIGHMHYG
ncbi:MAG: M48 family metalloprotease, partial [Candidatus Micrarchaeota archaeon]